MKSISAIVLKIILPLGAGFLLWQGARMVSPSVYGSTSSIAPAVEDTQSISSSKQELVGRVSIVPQGTEALEPVQRLRKTSVSPKDRAASVVTLGWGYRTTEAQ